MIKPKFQQRVEDELRRLLTEMEAGNRHENEALAVAVRIELIRQEEAEARRLAAAIRTAA